MFLFPTPKTQHLKPNRGLTLIEMIAVIAILGLLLILAIASYRNYRQRNNLKIAAQEIRSALVEASDYALAPQHQDTVTKEMAKGYGVELNQGNDTYYLFWSITTTYPYGSRHNIKTYQLPNRIQLSAPAGQTLVFFQVPPTIPDGREIEFKGGTAPGTITLNLSGTGETRNVTINCNTGSIDIK
jgi:prepilin-type N-terminal cleavage/methylation domain-containing protein